MEPHFNTPSMSSPVTNGHSMYYNVTEKDSRETKLYIIIDSETPVVMKVPMMPELITLGRFKSLASLPGDKYRFYFKSHDSEFGTVKEEVIEDECNLPFTGDKIIAWVISTTANQSALFESEDFARSIHASPKTPQVPNPVDELPIPVFGTKPTPPRRNLEHYNIIRGTHSLPRSITPRSLYAAPAHCKTISSSNDQTNRQIESRSAYEPTTPTSVRQFDFALHCNTDNIYVIYDALRKDSSSLDIKDREWLKVIVKSAFLGSSLVKWLSRNVKGFSNRRDIKRYANQMLSTGLIRDPMASGTFSEKCFYTLS